MLTTLAFMFLFLWVNDLSSDVRNLRREIKQLKEKQ